MSLTRSFLTVFGSGLIVNATTFAILAAAPIVLEVEEFARLSLAVAGTLFLVTLFDLGLGVSSTRHFSTTKDPAFLSLSIRARLTLCLIGGAPAGVAMAWPPMQPYAIIVVAAVALNLWTGLRTADQAREDFASFARANFAFAAARLTFAGTALVSGSWVGVMLGLFVVPVCLIGLLKFREIVSLSAPDPRPVAGATLRYAGFVFVSAVSFAALTALPAAVAGIRLDPIAIGTLGLAATFVGPISLLNYALRLILLPKVSANFGPLRPVLKPGHLALALLSFCVCVGGAAGVGEVLYSDRYPDAALVVGLMVGGALATTTLGLFNMDIHRLGAPGLEAAVNVGRVVFTAPAMWFAGTSTVALAGTANAFLVLGEGVLLLAILRRNARIAGQS